ncbi:uncharacterized protein LOC117175496 [Belonocnema kinseyi]|uniref:uncharacterized protein LOC117175496 n=1 Tax=Belonocnema kinseyi TaxID=2817044 RepID=UPI00143DCAB2|nr:uncharacterized protein LOC117175496 [Belonocnema kinseyi]
MSKSRVAPLKPLTVTRLELQAAVMGSRLAETIIRQHTLKILKRIFWTDSTTVLNWIRSDARNYQPFVVHRLAEVLDLTSVNEWRYVPTKINVADDATRDTGHIEIGSSCRWSTGPEFLLKKEQEWPQETSKSEVSKKAEKELKREFKCRGKEGIGDRELTAPEIEKGEKEVLKLTQGQDFADERKRLQQNKELVPTSKILELSPKLDEDGPLRMNGRIRNNAYNQSMREPVILNGGSPIVQLLIAFYHEKSGHIERERVINDLCSKYWITKIRSAVRAQGYNCLTCTQRKAKAIQPEMAPLPDMRADSFIEPSTNTEVDYFGPFQVTIGRRHEKRYGVLFTCLNVRAIHLELASSLSTDSMTIALRGMISRRGKPTRLFLDNGANFVGPNIELRRALEEFDQDEILRKTAINGVEWHFIPSASPHMGGNWERLVSSVKRALQATLKEPVPKEEVLQTLFAETEFSVNRRHLTYVSDGPADPESITPNHLLMPWRKHDKVPGAPEVFITDDLVLRKQWHHSQILADQFWHRWVKEYLPSLNRRRKWYRRTENLEVGDLIVIWDNQLLRNKWMRGIITAVYPGKDGRVRVTDVRTTTGTYKRPATKLCVLVKRNSIPDGTGMQEGESRERHW